MILFAIHRRKITIRGHDDDDDDDAGDGDGGGGGGGGGCGADYPYDNGIDHSCQADLQGYCRMERTVAYAKYVNWYCEHELGVDASGHKLLLVPDFGHDPCGLLQSEALRWGWREFLEPSDDDDDDDDNDEASPPDDDGRRADGHDDDAGRRNDPDGPP